MRCTRTHLQHPSSHQRVRRPHHTPTAGAAKAGGSILGSSGAVAHSGHGHGGYAPSAHRPPVGEPICAARPRVFKTKVRGQGRRAGRGEGRGGRGCSTLVLSEYSLAGACLPLMGGCPATRRGRRRVGVSSHPPLRWALGADADRGL